ncbi:MAG TPA: isoprenylcysteine carboxylmethyltransferase family protein [Candidatus Eisenbacteria bacterium]|nr:isoprenylcysteine carboxylmethyltransferase family protein [Candidatus Eisenbacteria bacterium]
MRGGRDRGRLIVGSVVLFVASIGIMLWGWGDWSTFWQNPARLGLVVLSAAACVVALAAPMSGLTGARVVDERDRLIFLPMLPLSFLFLYLPPWADRRDLFVLDGDTVRWAGLALFAAGCVLRIVPMFVLGYRFSPLVAIQEGHTLVTDGVYRWVRHPSYLGGLIVLIGWVLVFRSALGFLLVPPFVGIAVWRMNDEERLLGAEFGDEYASYRRRTWRLVPWVY